MKFDELCNLTLENNSKTVFDYLLHHPTGEELKYATDIARMQSDDRHVYRGMSKTEFNKLKREGKITSLGRGNTRGGDSPYVSDSIQLGGRFAIRAWKDFKKAVLVTFDKSKLPELRPADKGNYRVDYLTWDAVVNVYTLGF